jgi:conjugative relaxase-like TrwC/TraI family protein
VIAAHKSVALLGVLGRADDMHGILDAERDATMAFLDEVTRRMGGRRGRAAVATPTSGLVFAHTRHATSRAGDPAPHDHVLVANLIEMLDARGGWKAADTALWRDALHAATMAGRVAAARRAIELGYGIERDDGPSGRLGQWRIAGVPRELEEVFSKRAAQIDQAVARRGVDTYRARQVAARDTRAAKGNEPVRDLLARWQEEARAAGFDLAQVSEFVVEAAAGPQTRRPLAAHEVAAIAAQLLAVDGPLAKRKVFTRLDVTVAAAPLVFGRRAEDLDRVVGRVLADADAIALLGVAGARGTGVQLRIRDRRRRRHR